MIKEIREVEMEERRAEHKSKKGKSYEGGRKKKLKE